MRRTHATTVCHESDSNSPEIVEFKRSLEEATEMIKLAFSKRTPHLNGEKYLTTKLPLHMSE